jgi:short-subunit dehydrogenase
MQKYIVTGASKGIGYATTISLLERGDKVIAVARSEKILSKLTKKHRESVIPVAVDISTAAGLKKIISVSKDQNGIDGLINNAAILINKPFKELTIEEWKHHFEINLFAVVNLIQSLLPYFNKNAHILNVGSMGGYQGSVKFEGLSAYSGTKAALANLTESLALELSNDQIRVNCLALGTVSTEMQQIAFPNIKPSVSAKMMGEYIANFITSNGKLFNGKVIPVALNIPI